MPPRRRLLALLAAVAALLSGALTATTAAAAPGGPTVGALTVDGRSSSPGSPAGTSGAPGATAASASAASAASVTVAGERPALGWQIGSHRTGVTQSAYEVAVATSAQRLDTGRADVWDSGRVASDASVSVPYRGPALAPGRTYYWKVRVWDDHGAASAWSRTATWDTGLGPAADWHGARWITPDRSARQGWSDFTLDADVTVKSAAASVLFRASDASHYYMWQINAASTPGKVLLRPHVNDNGFRLLGEVDLGAVITPATLHAPHHLRITAAGSTLTTWIDGVLVDTRTDDTLGAGTIGFRTSVTAGVPEDSTYDNLAVHAPDGSALFSDDFSVSPDPSFPGTPVSDGQLEPKGDPTLLDRDGGAPMLRTDFTLGAKKIARARAYVFGLGFYELHLNGAKVGDQVLTPADSPYDKRDLYDTYDVTGALRQGANAVGIWLGRGYGPNFSRYGFRWTGPEQAIMLLQVTYADGTRSDVTTDPSWTWSDGPITADDIYDGEVYDARAARTGWDTPGYDTAGWQPVTTTAAPGGSLQAATLPPMRVVDTLRPVRVTQPRPGAYVYDFGQNIAGWERLSATGPAGTAVTMRTAEEVDPDGALDTSTNRDAASTDVFVLAGTGRPETYEPRFTYHGFRYLEVTGLPGVPAAADVTARVVHADVAATASFSSSDPLLDRIARNNRWSVLNNSMSIPTDNPVRDERTPPGMDVQAYHAAAVRDFGMDAFYANYLQDMPPGTALPSDDGNALQPDMGGDQVSLAWDLYETYGDRATLAAQYPAMKAFVDTREAQVPGHTWPDDRGFGDWCPPYYGPGTDGGMGSPGAGSCTSEVSLVNTALSFRQAQDTAKAARALGHPDDAAHFTALADAIEQDFTAHFLNAAGDTYGDGRQTTSILPLAFGMVPADHVAAVGRQLVDTVLNKNGGHLDTGIFGTRYLVDALAAVGRTDVAMTVLNQTSYPGFGFEIAHNATSSWEEWLYTSGMETHDHAMFAGVNASLYTVLAGIEPAAPGYAAVTVAPQVPAGLDHVAASLDTVRGRVAGSWTRHGGALTLTVTVPPNSTATVRVPLPAADSTVHADRGARTAGRDAHTATYTVGSGTWTFQAR